MTEVIELQERSRGTRCCVPAEPALSTAEAERITSDLQIMAHPVRLQILAILARQDAQVCVCDIEAAVPVKQPTVSHHLRLLREAGLIDCERHGLWAYYFVNRDALAALRARIEQQLAVLA
ncbi:MAG TPA: metalloregulator ArsR/SmtB family transcription factor [Herpetosiphonaceae bacterium]|nr:metalloregulator ArsR/SmtB family transcription factor [Herpetosiphonaceae bacterium]